MSRGTESASTLADKYVYIGAGLICDASTAGKCVPPTVDGVVVTGGKGGCIDAVGGAIISASDATIVSSMVSCKRMHVGDTLPFGCEGAIAEYNDDVGNTGERRERPALKFRGE